MTVYAITDTKKGEQGLRLLIFKLPQICYARSVSLLISSHHSKQNYTVLRERKPPP